MLYTIKIFGLHANLTQKQTLAFLSKSNWCPEVISLYFFSKEDHDLVFFCFLSHKTLTYDSFKCNEFKG